MSTTNSADPEALGRYARATGAGAARLEAEAGILDSALSRFAARCTEYRIGETIGLDARLRRAARATEELAGWVDRVANAFLLADQFRTNAFNVQGTLLLNQLTAMQLRPQTTPFANPAEAAARLAAISLASGGIIGLSIGSDMAGWAEKGPKGPGDYVDLAQQAFWEQVFRHTDPAIRLAIAAQIDTFNLRFSEYLRLVPAAHMPPQPYVPVNTVHGAYTAISYAAGEQVVLERLNAEGAYRLSVAGLDPSKPGAPNNLAAVMQTADYRAYQYYYYLYVRERLFAAIERIPPGSELHLQGHSMGGGMVLLLREDPEVWRRLREAQITVPSLTIYGAVVPTYADLRPQLPDDSAFANATLRAYVHTSDSLALNVGAGYEGYAEVLMVGGLEIDAPAAAHVDYASEDNYRDLPDELKVLPYTIDPAAYERTIPLRAPIPDVPEEEPPVVIAFP